MSAELWDICKVRETEFPTTGTTAEKLNFLLNYAVLTPFGNNTQPWLFKVENEAIYLYADRSRALPVADPDGRELIISCGTALFNLRLVLHHFGYKGEIATFGDPNNPDLLAHIQLGDTITESADEHMLFDVIPKPHPNRRKFQDWNIPQSLLSWLKVDAEEEGAWLYIVKSDTARQAVAELVVQGDRLQMSNSKFRRELAEWIHLGNSNSHDSIPSYTYSVDKHFDFATPIFALVMRTLDLGDSFANRSRQLVTQSPVIAVLGTKSDTPIDWLNTGQALERLLLRGQAVGLAASFLNQPIQLPQLRDRLNTVIHEQGYPQILLRMGFGAEVKPAPRRKVDEVVF